jgi:hypothetical protein
VKILSLLSVFRNRPLSRSEKTTDDGVHNLRKSKVALRFVEEENTNNLHFTTSTLTILKFPLNYDLEISHRLDGIPAVPRTISFASR